MKAFLRQNRALPYLAVLAGMFSLQSGASIAKHLFLLAGPLGVTTLRTSFAALLLAVVWRPWSRAWSRSQLQRILLYGLALGSMNMLFYLSLARIPLGVAVTLEFVGPLGYAILSSRRRLDFLWVVLAALGILLVAPHSGEASDRLGVSLALAAGLCWGLYIHFGRRAGKVLPSGEASSGGMIVAALWAAPFYWANPSTPAFLSLNLGQVLPLALAVAVLCSALPYSLEMAALKRIPPVSFGILMSVEPAVAALSGVLFLHEHLSPRQLLAIGLVILASAGSAWQGREVLADTP